MQGLPRCSYGTTEHLGLCLEGRLPLCRTAAGKDGGKGHRKTGPKRIYSNLTAQDHAWYLAKLGKTLPASLFLSPH